MIKITEELKQCIERTILRYMFSGREEISSALLAVITSQVNVKPFKLLIGDVEDANNNSLTLEIIFSSSDVLKLGITISTVLSNHKL